MVVARRSYAGGAKPASLTAPISAISTTLVCDALLGWPTGGLGNFAAVIGRGLSNEEKVLCSASSGGNLTVIQRGYDGTTAQAHGATDTVEHIFTATDADEANAHTSAVSGHGIPNGDRLVGENATQTLSGKTMSGLLNTFDDMPLASSPETLDRIVAVELVNTNQQVEIDALPTVAEVNALIAPGVAASAAADALRYTKTESDARYEPIDTMYTKAEADARYEPLDSAYTKAELDALLAAAVAGLTIPVPITGVDGTNFTHTNTTASPTSGGVSEVNGTMVVPSTGRIRISVSAVLRSSVGAGTYVGYEVRQTNVGGTILLASDNSRAAFNENSLAVSSASIQILASLTPGSTVFVRLLHWAESGATGAVRARRLVVEGA
jgi:hypothetical protein